jgi:predicted house-cleaning noncanonical NTP pyrophosphatase (MazG superfamily)
MIYNKLVRDNVPDIIKGKGEDVSFHIAEDIEYIEKLKEKLVEEAQEFSQEETLEEIADLLEVVDAIMAHKGFSEQELQEIKKLKAEKRGKFQRRIILEES